MDQQSDIKISERQRAILDVEHGPCDLPVSRGECSSVDTAGEMYGRMFRVLLVGQAGLGVPCRRPIMAFTQILF